jgi:hypothetical protein
VCVDFCINVNIDVWLYNMFISARRLKLEPISISLSKAQPFAFKGPHSQVVPGRLKTSTPMWVGYI